MCKSSIFVSSVFVALMLPAACEGSGGMVMFRTSVSSDRPLNGLSSEEIATLCMGLVNFASTSGLKGDECRLTGFVTASTEASSIPTATDAELQSACSGISTSCLTTVSNCPLPTPADCTASVADLVACANDSAAQTHLLASQVPACSGIDRTAIGANSSIGTDSAHQPASCQSYEAKCSGGSSADGSAGLSDGGGTGDGGTAGQRGD